jgi:tripartite-type tricarboxylate transporter receptor subunit TctC
MPAIGLKTIKVPGDCRKGRPREEAMLNKFNACARGGLAIAVTIATFAGGLSVASAQSKYPDRPVRIIMPYGPGGIADVTMRLVAQKLSERLGQNFFIDNRPGAGGIVATKAALGYPPDGYTLFFAGNAGAISESLFKSLPYNITRDFTSIGTLAQFDMLLATKTDSRLDSVSKLVAYAKANPGKLNFGTISIGSTQNLSAEMFKITTGIDAAVVIFKTTPDLTTAILRGDIDVAFDYYAAFRPMITSKQIKIIASSGDHPSPELPEAPLVKDSGYPEYVVTSWNALSGRTGVPQDIVTKLNQEIIAVLKMPDIQARMAELGMEPMIGTPEQMSERMARDIKKWAVVIEKAGIPKQ